MSILFPYFANASNIDVIFEHIWLTIEQNLLMTFLCYLRKA